MADRDALRSVVVACGGTGGHVYPAIAIARSLMARNPGVAISFVGRADSYESQVLQREGFEMDALPAGRLVGQGMGTRLRTLAALPGAIAKAARILRRRRASVVLGTGGFVSGPTVVAAALTRTPIVVQEQNAVAGLTNSVACALADRVALAHGRQGAPTPKFTVTGNPVRPEFFAVRPWSDVRPFHLLVIGGSQGARRLNQIVLGAVALLGERASDLRVTLQSGPRWEAEAREAAAACAVPVEVHPYLQDVPQRVEAASMVACRAGASTIAELCAAGRPMFLVPLQAAAGDHQAANARALAEAGAAEWSREPILSPERFAVLVQQWMDGAGKLAEMARRARACARPSAAESVALLCEEVAR